MKNKQEIFMDMIKNFTKLEEKDQLYVSGIIEGMFIQKTNTTNVAQAE